MPPTIKVSATFAIAAIVPAIALAMTADFPLPKFRQGIWATQHYREIKGGATTRSAEHVADQCGDPADNLRRGFLSARRDGCEIKVESRSVREISYLSTCPAGKSRLTVESPSAAEYTITTTSELTRSVQTGHWVRDCPGSAELPLPNIRRGFWSITTQPDLLSLPKSEQTVELCKDPHSLVRDELIAAEREGCSVLSWRRIDSGWNYGGGCSGEADNFSLVISLPSENEVNIMSFVGSRMKQVTGRWVRDCPATGAAMKPGQR